MALQPSLLGTIAMETFGAQSLNDLSFSIKTQTRSVLEILVLAMPHLPVPMELCSVSDAQFSQRVKPLKSHRAGTPSPVRAWRHPDDERGEAVHPAFSGGRREGVP